MTTLRCTLKVVNLKTIFVFLYNIGRKGKCQNLLLFEQRCLQNVLLTKYANLRGTVEEEVAMISDR